MSKTKIEWTDFSWNPITGCSPVSEGCEHCYAQRMSQRLKGRYGYPKDDPFKVTFHPDRLDQPLKWEKPRHIFVVSMGDLFHEDVDGDWMWRVLDTCYDSKAYHKHIFMFLTKRPDRMLIEMNNWMQNNALSALPKRWWLGVTAENQQRADERIPILLQIPAAKHFISIEPMLNGIDISPYLDPYRECDSHTKNAILNGLLNEYQADSLRRPILDWVITGGESGPGARPIGFASIYEIVRQCKDAGIPCFVKQTGTALAKNQGYKSHHGSDINEWPERIRIREFPNE